VSGLFDAAYRTALLGSCVSSWLTFVYVHGGARELNPVTDWIIRTLGFEAMVLVRGGVLVACYWGYAALHRRGLSEELVVAFAWAGAAVNVFDAGHDLREAVLAGYLPAAPVHWAATLVVGVAVVAWLFHPPSLAPGAPARRAERSTP
jgi:hypothetical protein